MNSVDTQRLYNCSALVLQQDLSIVRDMNRSELMNALEEALSSSVSREILRDQLSVCLFPGQQKPFDLQWWEKLSWALIFAAMLLVAIGGNTIVMWIVLATLAMSSTGYHYGWSSPSLPKLQANDSDIFLTSDEGSWVVSFFVVGTMFGPLIAAMLVDTLGRKWSLLMTAVPHTIAGILLATARGYWWFVIARCIAGIGSGMTFIVLPMYLGEIISDDIRGAVGAVVSQMMNAGILITYCVGPWVNRVGLAGLGIAFPICFSSIFIWMPESPYFLMMKNQPERATESLRRLRGTKDVSAEITKIERSIEFDRENAGSIRDLVTVPGNRKALFIVVGIVIAQQTSGIGAVLAYNGLIFREAGSDLDPSISVIIVGLVQVLSGILCVFTVDLTGRKPLLLGSTFGSIVFLGAHRRMRTVTNYFLVNLSVSDLMMSLLNCVFNFIFMLNSDWPFGAVYCTVNNFVANVTVASSVFTLVAISFDRYMAIVRPLQHRMSRRRALLAVAMIWLASALLALPCLLYSTTMTRRYSNGQTRIVCYMMWPDGRYPNSMREYIYNLVFLGVTYLVPVTVMAVCYTLMGLELWGSKSIGEHTQRQKESMKSKRKVVRMFIIVVTIFAVCWLPYHGFFIFAYHHRSFTNSIYVQHVYLAFYWLAMSNAMVNPIIYYWMNNRFRVYFQQIICCCFIGRSRTQSRQLECLAELPNSDLARSRSGKASRTIQVYLNSLATEHYRDSNTSTKIRQQNYLQRSSS